ncbi:MAG: SprB repeat-containing protein [Chitinophagales bacterium]
MGAPVDCSYDPQAFEVINVPTSTTGQVYLLLITNYANSATNISGNQIGGTGSTDCTILPNCAADAGTVTTDVGGNLIYLCDGADVTMTSDDNFVLPPLAGADPGGLGYVIYNCAPTTSDPFTDPCWTGYYWTGEDLTETNDASNLYDFVINNPSGDQGTNGTPTGDDLYFIPITMDDICYTTGCDANLSHDLNSDGCFDLGTPIHVIYLEDITVNYVTNCTNPTAGTGSVTVTISGGLPQYNGSNFTITDNGPGTLSTTSVANGGSVTINGLSDGDIVNIGIGDGQCNYGSYTADFDCGDDACLINSVLTANPPATNFPNDQYPPGTTVQFCFDINQYNQINVNFLHGIVPSFGPGWDLSSLTPTVNPSVAANNEPGSMWQWFPGNTVTYNSPPSNIADAGWWFLSSNSSGGVPLDPDNSWGDGCTATNGYLGVSQAVCEGDGWTWVPGVGCTSDYVDAFGDPVYLWVGPDVFFDWYLDFSINQSSCLAAGGVWDAAFGDCGFFGSCFGDPNDGMGLTWTACFEITTSSTASCTPDQDLHVEVKTYADGETGTWTDIGCTLDQPVELDATACCIPPPMAVTQKFCEGTVMNIVASSSGYGVINWYNVASGGIALATGTNTYNPGALAPGSYTFYVEEDDNGCVSHDRTPVIVNVDPLPDITIDLGNQVICLGESATIQTTITIETSISWNNPGNSTTDDILVTPTATTTYTVTATNLCGVVTYPVVITINPPIVLNTSITNATCNGVSDGAIDLIPTGGSAPYTYDWDIDGTGDFDDSQDLNSLAPGDYTVVVKDFYDCSSMATFTVQSLGGYDSTGITLTTCNPANAGVSTITLTNTLGCDSIVTTITTLLPEVTNTVMATTLRSTIAGTTVDTFTAFNTCDSIVTTITTLLPSHNTSNGNHL